MGCVGYTAVCKNEGDDAAREKYLGKVRHIMDYIIDNRHPNLHVDHTTGLLVTYGEDKPVSWMNSMLNGRPVIPRTGMLVEFNALWYNALMFASHLVEGDDTLTDDRDRWLAQAEKNESAVCRNLPQWLRLSL